MEIVLFKRWKADREPLQLEAIARVCGTPSPALWPEVIDLRFFHTIKPKKNYRRRLRFGLYIFCGFTIL